MLLLSVLATPNERVVIKPDAWRFATTWRSKKHELVCNPDCQSEFDIARRPNEIGSIGKTTQYKFH